ncbi:MAG: DPP IV N-terminal domain-containing protein [Actinobacteria bacterium]|nr:DPP IV N-terminal domain-containing protein [Actinomycetota bacterium]
MGALVVLAAEAGSIEPGGQGETVVLVRNTGEATGDFRVSIQGPAAAWATVEPQILTLAPDEEAPAWLCFRPPRVSELRPGGVPFSVVVRSGSDGDLETVTEGVLRVGTFSSLSASFIGEPSVGARWAELAVAVRNTGNRGVTVSVGAEAGHPDVSLEVEPEEVQLAPGEAADFKVRVRPPRRLLPGAASQRKIAVAVVSDGGALATLRTELPEEPSLAHELFRSARVLGILLILLVVAGLSILRSATDSGTVDVTTGDGPPAPLPLPSTGPVEEDPQSARPPEPKDGQSAAQPAPELGSGGVSGQGPAPAPPLPRLVFVRVYGPGSQDLVVRQPGNKPSELRLRSDGALESRPQLSPGGRHVAFVRERDLTWKVCVIPSGGGEAVCLADASAASAVAWAPGGAALYFTRAGRLYEVPYDVTTEVAGEERDLAVEVPSGHFSLSPAGNRIVFAHTGALTIRPLDGSAGLQIDVPGQPEDPAWSPDGSRIVYASNFQIYTAPAGSGPVRQLTANGTVNGEPSWCAEGDWVIFRSNRSGVGDLYVVKGSPRGVEVGLAQVTNSPEREVSPAF